MRRYAVKAEVVTSSGEHVRYVPGPMAKAMVDAGSAEIAHQNGRVKSIRLIETAATHLTRIGEPTGRWGGVRFHRWVNLDCGARIVEHHPRATYG